jgi:hypothetical protein
VGDEPGAIFMLLIHLVIKGELNKIWKKASETHESWECF